MRLHTIAAAAAFFLLLSVNPAPAEAAGAKSKKSGSARSAATKPGISSNKARRAGKQASARTVSGKSKSGSKVKGMRTVAFAAALPAPIFVSEVPLTLAQLDVARLVQTGVVHCEMGQRVVIEPQAHRAGAFNVRFGGATYNMVPEETSTGAVRLSDPRAGVVWLQIPVKSMLMDTRQGQRMVDACATPFQRSAQADASARSAHAGSMAVGAEGLGIAPTPLVPAAGYASAAPVAPGAMTVDAVALPAVIPPIAIVPGTPSALTTGSGIVLGTNPAPGSPTLPADASAIGGSPGANGTSGAGSAGDTHLLRTPSGATAAVAPSSALTSDMPSALPVPSPPPMSPN